METERERERLDLLHPVLLSRRAEFVPGVPGRQSVGVGDVAGHVEGEPGQHDEAREVPFGLQLVLPREDLDTLGQACASFHRNSQPSRQVVDVDPAVACEQRLFGKDPEVPAAARLFERRLNSVLAQLPLQLEQVFECVLVIGIDSHPLGALRLWIEGVDPNRQPSSQMLADDLN